jgi:hypothetical protein
MKIMTQTWRMCLHRHLDDKTDANGESMHGKATAGRKYARDGGGESGRYQSNNVNQRASIMACINDVALA